MLSSIGTICQLKPNYPECSDTYSWGGNKPFICSGGEWSEPPVMGQCVACWQLSEQMYIYSTCLFIHCTVAAYDFFLIKTCRLMQIMPPPEPFVWYVNGGQQLLLLPRCNKMGENYKTGTRLKPDATSNWVVRPPAFKR